jgi:hypothetical protein
MGSSRPHMLDALVRFVRMRQKMGFAHVEAIGLEQEGTGILCILKGFSVALEHQI